MENRYLKNFTFLLLLVFTNVVINAQNFINYGPSDGLIEGGIYSIIEDHNNVFWFGSWTNPEGTGGLGSFDGTTFNHYSTDNGLAGNNVTVVYEDSANNLWIGTRTGVSKFDGSVITNYTVDNGLVFNEVWDILEDTNGNIWFSTHQGVSMFDGVIWTNYTLEDYPALVYVNDIMMDTNGDIWFGSAGGGGVSKFDGTTWTNYTSENSGLVANDVFVVYQDIDNNYWFGTYFGGGVSKFDGTTWTAYTTADGLSNNKVRVITQDSFGDLWFGTNTGLSRYNGSSWQTYTTADGLIPGGVRAITQDSNDDLWVGTWSSGLSKLEISKVNIPDANFEQSLLDLGIDSDGVLNGQILRADAILETDLNLTNPLFQSDGFENPEITTVTGKIADLSGIEAFVNLTSLQLGNASLRSVDISNNTKLDNLFFNDNLLMSIDVSKNTLLTRFGVMRNPDIAGLDVSNNLLLEELFVDGTAMTSIDVSSNINLWKFYGRWGNLTGIDLSNNINLRDIRLRGSGNLTYLNIRNGNNINVTAFDVRDMANLSCITTDDAQSQLMIDFSNGKIFSPDCGTVYIPDQNFEQALIDLGIDATGTLDGIILRSEAETVTELWLLPVGHPGRDPRLTFTGQIDDLSGIESFTSLIQLHCVQQNINTIDFSSNTNLRVISLPENGLTSINVENNLLLDHLFLFNNNLTTIDVSNNLLLRELVLQSNLITELDISGNTNIKTLFATDNNLTNLNIANGNNANFQIPYGAVSFGAAANPDLACIQVDPDMIGNIGAQPWEYDTGVLFSADCDTKPEYVAIPDTNFEQALIDLGIDGNIGDPINGFILKSDAEAVVELNVNNRGINDLTGIEAFTSLSVLYCQYNQLQELNVTNNAALTILECEGNELTELNVTQNPLLRVLGFGPNNISEIDVSQNLLLEAIWTNGNNLSSINLDANTKLVVYGLSNNPYSYVSLKNGNNTNVFYFEASNTPSLDCINSDADVSGAMLGSGKTFSEDCSTSMAGRWIIAPEAGSLKVGPTPGSDLWWFLNKFGDDIAARSCYMDDIYEFGADGSFKNVLGDETFLEAFQNGTQFDAFCATPVAPHNGSAVASYAYNQLEGKITINGKGAYLGLPKVFNGGELSDPNAAPDSIIYDVSFLDNGNAMTLSIESSAGVFWTFKLIKEAVFIPDTNFEQALIDLNIDNDGTINNRILRSDAEAQTGQLDVSNKNISDLTGIEAFTNLTRLKAWDNQITSVDVTQNINLTRLEIVNNQLSNIDVTNNTELTILWLENNLIETIDVSNNTKLLNLAVGINPLIALDVSQNINLWALTTEVTQISEVDLTQNIALEQLWIADNPNLTKLDVSKNPLLFNLGIYNTSITTLDLSNNNIIRLYAYDNPFLEHLDMRNDNNLNVTLFYIGNTPNLSCINVDAAISQAMIDERDYQSKTFSEDCGDFVYIPDENFEQSLIDLGFDSDGVINTSILREDAEAVTYLNLNNSLFTPEWYDFNNPDIENVSGKIEDLTGIEAFINLTNLQISYSNLTTIDVSNNTLLEELWVTDGILTGIDVTSNTSLIQLGVSANNITGTVDVSENTALELLFIGINPINSLDVTSNASLSYLWVPGTQITSLDISLNPNLQRLDAQYNPGLSLITDPAGYPAMTSLNLSGIGLSNYNLYAPLFPYLQWLLLNDNSLTRFNGNNALLVENLFLNNNSIDKLVLSSNTALKQLHANNNVLTELDVKNGNNLALQTLNVTENLLTCINVDDPLDGSMPYALWNTDLGVVLSDNCSAEPEIVLIPDPIFEQKLIDEGIDLDGIGLNGSILLSDALATTQLDVYLSGITDMTGIEAFENLETLNASFNNFNEIDLTNCTNLVTIDLSFNNLTTLNVTSGKVLTQLDVGGNEELTTLNLEALTNLTNVDLSFNKFESIDASGLDQLLEFSIHNNNLSTLDMRNGNNAAMVNFSAENNLNLACIGVDDPISISETIWKINGSTVFSSNSDCVPPTVVSKDVTIFLDNKGKATAVASQFDNGSTDNITANANLVFSLNKTDFNCSDFGSNVVELSVTDEAGNVGIGYANVIVNDAIPPIAKAVREYAFDLAGGNTTLDASILNNGSTDNCSIASFSLSQSYFTLPGIYYVDFIARDIGGNEGKTQVKLTVSDSDNSEILTVGNVTVTAYPNPFQDYISLKFSKNMDFSTVNVSLTDFNGNPTGASFAVQDLKNLKATGLSGLAPGSYILTVSKGRKSDTAIMIKN